MALARQQMALGHLPKVLLSAAGRAEGLPGAWQWFVWRPPLGKSHRSFSRFPQGLHSKQRECGDQDSNRALDRGGEEAIQG